MRDAGSVQTFLHGMLCSFKSSHGSAHRHHNSVHQNDRRSLLSCTHLRDKPRPPLHVYSERVVDMHPMTRLGIGSGLSIPPAVRRGVSRACITLDSTAAYTDHSTAACLVRGSRLPFPRAHDNGWSSDNTHARPS